MSEQDSEQPKTAKVFNGKSLRQLRNKMSLNQTDLSAKTKINSSTISKLENGKNLYPTPDTVARLATFFEVSPDSFLMEKPIRPESTKPPQKKVTTTVKPNPGNQPVRGTVSSIETSNLAKSYAEASHSPLSGSAQVIDTMSSGDLLIKFNGQFFRATKL